LQIGGILRIKVPSVPFVLVSFNTGEPLIFFAKDDP
jgi:hypothetical protein